MLRQTLAARAGSPRPLRSMPVAALTLLLSACAAGPDYVTPEVAAPAAFDRAEAALFSAAAPQEAWWRSLEDPALSKLVDEALRENHDLRIAQANLRAARAFLASDRLDRWPVVTAAASATRQQASNAAFAAQAGTETYYQAGFDASWELDFFGRLQRSVEASTADYEAAVAGRHDVAVTVAAEVARSFIELRGAQRRLAVARSNAANQRKSLELTRLLLEGGRGTRLDVARAEAQLETTLASIEPLEAAVARAIHRLGVLTGEQPAALRPTLAEPAPLPELPSVAAIGDPAGLLRRRADLRQAERKLAAATARIGIATADLFPRVTLLGSAAYLATSIDGLGEAASEQFSIGPFLSWAAFDLGRVRARVEAAGANADAQLAAYEQAVLRALEETENALVDYARARNREARLQVAAGANAEAVELARIRYRSGADDFLSVLDAERRLFETQDQLAAASVETSLAFVSLYKALGGGWEYPQARS